MGHRTPAETDAGPRSGRLFTKVVVGSILLALLWAFVLRDTRLDPVRQVLAAINHLVNPERPVDFQELAKQIPAADDRAKLLAAAAKIDEGDYTGAARELTLLSTKYPTISYPLGRHYVMLAEDCMKHDKYRQANECLRISIDYFVQQSGRAHLLLAETYERLQQPADAQRHRDLARSLETDRPNNPFDPMGLALSLALTLIASLIVGALLSAVLGTGRAASDEGPVAAGDEVPTFWTAPDTTGSEDAQSGAEKKYGSITKVLTAEERLDQVKILFEEKLYKDAYEVFRKAASLNPAVSKKITKMCLDEGIKLYEADEVTQAAELFDVCLQHDPHSLHGHTYLANCCIKLDLFDKAVEHYLAVVRINPDNATGYYNLGICYHKIGDVQNAMRAFSVAIEKEDLPNAHFYLAKLNEATGDKAAAIKHWKRCAELAPDTPQGKRAQERLSAISASH